MGKHWISAEEIATLHGAWEKDLRAQVDVLTARLDALESVSGVHADRLNVIDAVVQGTRAQHHDRIHALEAAMPGKIEPQSTASRVQRCCYSCRAELAPEAILIGDVICSKCIAKQRNDNA